MGRIAVLLATLAVLVAPAPALALDVLESPEPFPDAPRLDNERIRASILIAEAFFDAAPACGQVTVYTAPLYQYGFAGIAQPASCRVWLDDHQGDDYFARVRWCTILAHELGHLLGLGHAPAPPALMYRDADTSVVYGCYRRFVPVGAGRRWRAVMGDTPWSTL